MEAWGSKWNYLPVFSGEVSTKTIEGFSVAQIKKLYNAESLIWNDFEESIIDKALKIANDMFEGVGFKPISVDKKQLTILSLDQYESIISQSSTERGRCSNGHVYICRNSEKAYFIADLLHELSHLYSFYSLAVSEESKRRSIEMAQLGYAFYKQQDAQSFVGLNEATTELWSKVLMCELFKVYPKVLSEAEKDLALNYYAYPYHSSLIEEIVFKLTKDDVLLWPLLKSYFDGSNDFLDLLKKELPLASEAIEEMSSTKEAALSAAYRIGGDALFNTVISI